MALDPHVQHMELLHAVQPALRKAETEELAVWQGKARARLAQLLGMQYMIPCEANLRIDYVKELEDCVETRFEFESEPGATVAVYLHTPKGVAADVKLPVIICLQGHSSGAHISLGTPKYPGDYETIHGGDRDFAVQIVSRGQAALAVEQRGFGERGGNEKGPQCHQPAVQAMLLGRTLIGERCWDISRTLDVIEKHFPQLDCEKVAIMGNSGGGTATIYAAALDERLAAAMPSCALAGFVPSIGAQHHCLCNYVPGILRDFDMGDLIGLIAPRPCIAINGQHDGIFPVDSAKEQIRIAKAYYGDAADNLRHIVGPEGHRFYADLGWPVFDELTGWEHIYGKSERAHAAFNETDLVLQHIAKEFRIRGAYDGYEEIKVGNVNRTYRVQFTQADGTCQNYIVQRLNTYVFNQPIAVMENIDKVTEHIRNKFPNKTSLHFYHTADRKTYVLEHDARGEVKGFWRLFNYVPSTTYNEADDLDVVRNAGMAFGEFQMALADFDATKLHDTIPNFHNTRKRYEKLEEDAAADPCGRVSEVQAELEWLLSVKDKACTLTDMFDKGELPPRVTHNDTKINNVLFEKGGKEAIVVIDLDTVMPGLVGADFGDAIRYATNFVAEDSPEYDKAGVNMEVFRAFAEGFMKHTASSLTQNEIDTLALGGFMLACELSTRFLDDYLLGDKYFKVNYPKHNLVRTRCQIAMAKDMLRHLDEMNAIVQECAAKYKK